LRRNLPRSFTYEKSNSRFHNLITGFVGTNEIPPAAIFINLPVRRTASYSQELEYEPSRRYSNELEVVLNKLNIEKREEIGLIVEKDDAVLLFEDYYGQYWLMGEWKGCKTQWNRQTGEKGGSSQESLTFNATENFPIRQVERNFARQLIGVISPLDADCFCGTEIVGNNNVNTLTINDICGNFTINQLCTLPIRCSTLNVQDDEDFQDITIVVR
jgi:hypothetical protein